MLRRKNERSFSKFTIAAMIAFALCFVGVSYGSGDVFVKNPDQLRSELAKALGCPAATQGCIMSMLQPATQTNKALAAANSTLGLATRAASSSSAIAAAGRISEAASAVVP